MSFPVVKGGGGEEREEEFEVRAELSVSQNHIDHFHDSAVRYSTHASGPALGQPAISSTFPTSSFLSVGQGEEKLLSV